MDNVGLFFLIFGLNGKSHSLDSFMIFGAEIVIYFAIVFSFILAFKRGIKERKALLLALIATPILLLIIKIIHLFMYLPRPFIAGNFVPLISFQTSGPSFPSFHTSIVSMIAFSFIYFKSKWSLLFILLMVWVGLSRIYVGVHYPLDILGGIGVGILSLAITIMLSKFLKTGRGL